MSKRFFLFGVLLSSLLGGMVSVWVYTQYGPQPEPVSRNVSLVSNTQHQPLSMGMASYLTDSSFTVPEGLNFVYAAELATPAVVHISSTYTNGTANNTPYYDLFRDFFDDNSGRRPYRNRPDRATGSGVFISADGYIVTNNHVVENADEIEVTLWNNEHYEAEVVGTDPTTDLAVIKIEGESFPKLSFGNSDNIRIGEWVLAVGNPFDLTSTVTAGIVSAKARNINILGGGATIESFIQTDAAVNPGNSGGALVNLKGQLIGVNTAIASRTGSYVGYSFAVPAALVQKVAEDLIEFGAVQRALLGIRIVNVSTMEDQDLGINNGVYINMVTLGGSADEAGLEEGDVIIGINDKPVNNVAELQEMVGRNRPGDQISLTFLREGKRMETSATLKNSMGDEQLVRAGREFSLEGATFENLSEKDKSEFDLPGGVRITSLSSGKWQEAGIPEGFIITSIDKQEVKNLTDLERVLNAAGSDRIIVLGLEPDGSKAYYIMDW